jgi:hypothetical protein
MPDGEAQVTCWYVTIVTMACSCGNHWEVELVPVPDEPVGLGRAWCVDCLDYSVIADKLRVEVRS